MSRYWHIKVSIIELYSWRVIWAELGEFSFIDSASMIFCKPRWEVFLLLGFLLVSYGFWQRSVLKKNTDILPKNVTVIFMWSSLSQNHCYHWSLIRAPSCLLKANSGDIVFIRDFFCGTTIGFQKSYTHKGESYVMTSPVDSDPVLHLPTSWQQAYWPLLTHAYDWYSHQTVVK